MAMTVSEKIIAKACGQRQVEAGKIVTCKVDLAMMHDSSGPRMAGRMLDELGASIWDNDKLVIITDHYTNDENPDHIKIQTHAKVWSDEHQVRHFIPNKGICHVVLAERGYLKPGMFCVGGDSHSTTGGALGAFMIGIGSSDLLGVLATGEIWVRVPESVSVKLIGKLELGVSAKDIVLHLCGKVGMMGFNYKVLEYLGPVIDEMSIQERMTLTNMAAELGAKTAIVPADTKTIEFLGSLNVLRSDIYKWQSDENAHFCQKIVIDCNSMVPHVAAPSSPENSAPISSYPGVKLNHAYIGTCTGAKLDDLRMAASILKGKKIAESINFFIAPASVSMGEEAEKEGLLKILIEAGGKVLPSGCGGCIGLGEARLGPQAVGISTANRNFVGRAGDKSSSLYLASPFTVAASAIAGKITDPREFF